MLKSWKTWGVVAASGLLIVASWLVGRLTSADAVADGLMIIAALVAGYRIAVSAVQALRIRMISIDLLVVVAAVGAMFIDNYWESAAVTFLFALGKALEKATLNRTRRALSDLVDSAPETATILRDGEPETVEVWELEPGDLVLVRNGEQVPVDGRVLSGNGGVDEATITGESVPAEKSEGSEVFAGTWLRSGVLRIEAVGIGADTTLARIVHRVEDAQDDKARTQTFMERFSTWYTPAVMISALVVALIPWSLVATMGNIELALTLLVIGCPGALVISIPVSIVAGIGRSAKDGVLIKGGEYLESAARVDAVVVDKTGTLTNGRPVLTDVDVLDDDYSREDVLRLAARAETASEHPLAEAIISGAREAGLEIDLVEAAEPVAGKGIRAEVDGRVVAVGSADLLDHRPDNARILELNDQGRTAMFVGVDGRAVGIVTVADTIRDDAPAAVRALHDAGIRVVMATGDAQRVARNVGAELGVDEIRAELMPEDKVEIVRELQSRGHTVAMVGDGVNDTPALALADIGVAMGAAGSPAAIETADIALMADRLPRLPYALSLAKRTVRTMRLNIAIALVTVAALLAGLFLGGVTMSIGMLVHEVSVLAVIAIAMLLLRPTLEKDGTGIPGHAGDLVLGTGARDVSRV
ncbi:Cd2+/Zn2+-exporting ATPase [Dietzia kunjamensis]|jgi:Cd2+/Zn2+-exporting ATPase|uniref:Cadmium-translocating P-type ATPase n=1 Tax=Dietzia maris TaxID=37915 RepID=A0A365PBU1_9ACTN|nr:cadmium-translocating P-type ATPase [Dietzia sp. SLG510A3-30A2]MBB0993947.1 cadmium-translocating P-type ATPase [Dietzia sp. SLG510A3-40A3]MBB0997449.1 cadmium-translocating P-type ATPase [Dietzia maris]MBB1008148.1 cadmium-translocating P-type ATPase [Dietzia sp. SLG510A3-3B2-2]MBB1011604.1 cadmium-translocating P-type ATPase [Dietzia kunjamensis]MBB1018342.1 cadmium-translocating P-type ATPase [Dietzia sp. DQ11-71]MBC7305915.1 cadmium-translocating P-type ATPase [Dietzia sp.]OAV77682.1 